MRCQMSIKLDNYSCSVYLYIQVYVYRMIWQFRAITKTFVPVRLCGAAAVRPVLFERTPNVVVVVIAAAVMLTACVFTFFYALSRYMRSRHSNIHTH